MAQNISERSDRLPWLIRHQVKRHISELRGGFTNSFKATFYRIIGSTIILKRLKSMAIV